MPSQINLAETANTSISTPAAGKDAVFFDTDGAQKIKNSSGNVRTADATPYRTLAEFPFTIPAGITSGIVLPNTNGIKSGADIGNTILPMYSYLAADFGTGAKFRLKCRLATNAIAPGTITFTFGLYSVTFAGAASTFVPTVGTVVTGSTVAFANPGSSASIDGTGTDWAVGAANFTDGAAFIAAVNLSASTAATSITKGVATLQTRNA